MENFCIPGFKRPFKVLKTEDGIIICLTRTLKRKLFIIYPGGSYFSKSINDLGIEESSQISVNRNNQIAILDDINKKLKIFHLKNLIQLKEIDIPGSKFGKLFYDIEKDLFYITILDQQKLIKISNDFNIHVYFDYSRNVQVGNIDAYAFINNHLITLDKEKSQSFNIPLTKPKEYNLESILKYGRKGRGESRHPTDILKFKNYIVIFDTDNYFIQFFDLNLKFSRQIGGKGTGLQKFDMATSGFANDSELLICDENNDRIISLTPDLSYHCLITDMFQEGVLSRPSGIATDKNRMIYVPDRSNNVIQVFSAKLKFLFLFARDYVKFYRPSSVSIYENTKEKIIAVLERRDGQNSRINFFIVDIENPRKINEHFHFDNLGLNDPQDIHISRENTLHIADTLNRRILQIDTKGNIKSTVDMKRLSNNNRILVKTIFVDDKDNIYTADFENCIVYIIDKKLDLVKIVDFSKIKDNIKVIRSVLFTKEKLYLCTRGSPQLIVSDLDGNIIQEINIFKASGRDWSNPVKMCTYFDEILVADKENDRVLVLDEKNSFVKSIGGSGN